MPRYRQLTASQFQLAFEWLEEIGVVVGGALADPTTAREAVFTRLLESSKPPWLDGALSLSDLADDLPLDVADIAEDLSLPVESVLKSLRGAALKFDAERLAQIGLRGETLFVDLLRSGLNVQVEHLSLHDDTLGFDARARGNGQAALIEMKTTVGVASRFFLSRHEFDRMRQSEQWCLQLIHISDDRITSLGFATSEWLSSISPRDSSEYSHWSSTYVEIPSNALGEGLHPQILATVTDAVKAINALPALLAR